MGRRDTGNQLKRRMDTLGITRMITKSAERVRLYARVGKRDEEVRK